MKIVWRAFELRPEPVPTLDPNGEYLHRVWGSSVYPMAERLGMKIRLPPVQPRSRLAHEAAHWARTQGRFDDYKSVLTDEQDAQARGISGVPAFVADRKAALNGVQSVEGLRELVEHVRK